jgi:hypothetical protein
MRALIIILLFFSTALSAEEKQEEKEKKEKWYTDKFQLLYGKHVYPNQEFKLRVQLGGVIKNIILNQVLTLGITPIEFIGFKTLLTYTAEHHSFTGPCYGCNGISWEESIRRYQHSILTHSIGLGLLKEFKFKLFKKDFQINVGITLERILPNNSRVYYKGKVFIKPNLSIPTNPFYADYFYKDLLEIRIVKTLDYKLFWTFNGLTFLKNDSLVYWPLEYSLTSLITGIKIII